MTVIKLFWLHFRYQLRPCHRSIITSLTAVVITVFFIAGCGIQERNPTGENTPKPDPTGYTNENDRQPAKLLKVHFIDVGQADCILIQFPSGQNMLIDAGNNDDGAAVTKYIKGQGIKHIDHIIGTHPHEDHIGGMDDVLRNFDVGEVYLPKVSHNTKTYRDLLLAIKDKKLQAVPATAGLTLELGEDIDAMILSPALKDYDGLNNYSVVLKITFGQTSFLFCGDAEEEAERDMLVAGYDLSADVLKAGHHGSHSSTIHEFLRAVKPKYAIIMAGLNNDYGHPHTETLSRLASMETKVLRTDLQGSIVATSDGQTVSFNVEPFRQQIADSKDTLKLENNNFGSDHKKVAIISLDLVKETVIIKNRGENAVNLTGWKLESEKGNQIFDLPSGTLLPAGETMRIISGPKAAAQPGDLIWTKDYIWNNDGDPGRLFDAAGNLVSSYPR